MQFGLWYGCWGKVQASNFVATCQVFLFFWGGGGWLSAYHKFSDKNADQQAEKNLETKSGLWRGNLEKKRSNLNVDPN